MISHHLKVSLFGSPVPGAQLSSWKGRSGESQHGHIGCFLLKVGYVVENS